MKRAVPNQIFENPQKPKTRAFIHRIRSFYYRITSPDYDLYAMNAEIEAFCEKHVLSRQARHDLLLLVEELLLLYHPWLASTILDLTIAYSEKTDRLEIVCEAAGATVNPLDQEPSSASLGLMIIRSLAESTRFTAEADRSRLELKMKKEQVSRSAEA